MDVRKVPLAAGALCLSLFAGNAQSAVLFSFEETGSNVVGMFSGAIDLTGMTGAPGNIGPSEIHPFFGRIVSGPDPSAEVDSYNDPLAPRPGPGSGFGTGGPTAASSATGSPFLFQRFGSLIAVPVGYMSGQALGGTITFADATFATLGITPGEYVWPLPSDTVTVRFGQTEVIPLPATLPLMLGALGLTLAAARRRG